MATRYFIDDEAACSDSDSSICLSWLTDEEETLPPTVAMIRAAASLPSATSATPSRLSSSAPVPTAPPTAPTATSSGGSAEEAAPAPTDSAGRFRLQAKGFFLTFPQWNCAKEVVLENIRAHFADDLAWAVVARELHQDGNPHLHVLIFLKKKLHVRQSNYFDFVARTLTGETKHGNYQSMRNQRESLVYVCKTDESPVSWGINPQATIAKKNGRAAFIAAQVVSGASTSELIKEDPGFMLLNLGKVKAFQEEMRRDKMSEHRSDAQYSFHLETGGVEALAIVSWLNINIREERQFKKKQLYLWGPPNVGKTTLVNYLSTFLSVYWAPIDGGNLDDFEDNRFDVVVFDEFHGQHKMTWMNYFLQGGNMNIHRRYQSTIKTINVPCIILSNKSPQEAYSKVDSAHLESFLTRLTVVNITTFFKVRHEALEDSDHE